MDTLKAYVEHLEECLKKNEEEIKALKGTILDAQKRVGCNSDVVENC